MSEPETPSTPSTPPPSPPPPSTPEAGDSGNRNVMIVLAYLGPLALIPLLVEKEDAEVQWHAKHGLVLLVAWIALGLALGVLSMIPALGCVFGLVGLFIPLAILVIHIICIVKGVGGERFLIPGISQYADKLNF
ncbi:MAG: hypothetical protein V3T81_02945 [Thermoanaerobaculia bacterium]